MSLFTASWSRRGGACSAQTFGAVACGGTAEGDAAAGATPSAACVVALHLSSALRSLAVAGQCSGSCTPMCNEVRQVCGAVVRVCEVCYACNAQL